MMFRSTLQRYPSNWELSTARAVTVLRYFIETYGISSKRLAAEGFAEYHPIAPNDSIENRAQNRRVEIIFLNADFKRAFRRGRTMNIKNLARPSRKFRQHSRMADHLQRSDHAADGFFCAAFHNGFHG